MKLEDRHGRPLNAGRPHHGIAQPCHDPAPRKYRFSPAGLVLIAMRAPWWAEVNVGAVQVCGVLPGTPRPNLP